MSDGVPPGPPPSGPPPGWGPPSGPPSGPPPGWGPPTGPPVWPPPQEPGRRRAWPAVAAAVALAVLVVAGAIVLPQVLGDDGPRAGGRSGSGEESSDSPTDGSDGSSGSDGAPTLDDVRTYPDLPTTHVDGEVDYEQSPSVGGEHNAIWLDCGVYDEPVPEQHVTHDLEHGTVWLTYDPDEVDDDGVAALTDLLPQNGILSPYPGLGAPVVATVWGTQLDLEGPDDARLALFIESFGAGETAPEPFASCAGGASLEELPALTGGDSRPA